MNYLKNLEITNRDNRKFNTINPNNINKKSILFSHFLLVIITHKKCIQAICKIKNTINSYCGIIFFIKISIKIENKNNKSIFSKVSEKKIIYYQVLFLNVKLVYLMRLKIIF